jgi:hypothetical protein
MCTAFNPTRVACLGFFLAVLLARPVHAQTNDHFLLGYATAILEQQYKLKVGSMKVQDGVVLINASDLPAPDKEKIVTTLRQITGVVRVELVEMTDKNGTPPSPQPGPAAAVALGDTTSEGGEFLPSGRLFDPLIADPRSPSFSAAYQSYHDDPELGNVGAVSLGATIELYEDNFPGAGRWQMGIEAAVYSIFDLDAPSSDLVNADYWVGVPFSYRYQNFSGVLRVFHQSSHLGDEYLLRNETNRLNLSYEGVDLRLSYDLFKKVVRIYGGGGYLFRTNPDDLGRWSTQGGLELRSPRSFFGNHVRPVAAVDVQHREEADWRPDISARGGFQFESEKLRDRNLQLMFEYFRGKSPNGQFFGRTIEYWGVGIHFYFD